VTNIEPFTIDSTDEADDYLNDLLETPKNRTVDEVLLRAQAYVPDAAIREHFVTKGKELLKNTYGVDVDA